MDKAPLQKCEGVLFMGKKTAKRIAREPLRRRLKERCARMDEPRATILYKVLIQKHHKK